jgi:hypothetical protein
MREVNSAGPSAARARYDVLLADIVQFFQSDTGAESRPSM